MASGKGNYLINKELNHSLNGAAFSSPTELFLRLYTTALTAAGVGTELSADGYAPVEIECNTTNFPTTSDNSAENGVAIAVGTAEEDWGDLDAWGLWDAGSGGNLHYFGEFDPPLNVLEGAILVIPVGMLQINVTNEA